MTEQIVPRIRAAIPGCAIAIGAEDHEELVADCICAAAQMLHRLEEIGKQVTPGNIAYYAVLNTRSGRRSQGGSRNDVLGAGTQLDGKSSVMSMEEEIGYDPETGESVCLGDLLGTSQDDPAIAASRNLDWAAFIDSHDYRYGVILSDIAKGRMYKDSAHTCGVGSSRIHEMKGRIAEDLRAYLGEDALADVLREPAGHADLRANRERAACHTERSHQH